MSLLETYVQGLLKIVLKISLTTVIKTILHVDEYIIWMSEGALMSTNSFNAKENRL